MGIDIADGILAGMVSPVMCADASALPLEDNCCDAVLAMHMLYHVPNISIAISEFDRALSSHGLLISSTNFVDDKRELDELWTRAVGDVFGTLDPPKRVKLSRRYLLEDANAVLSSHFSNISTQHLTGVITITDSAPLVAHLASYRPFAASAGIPFTETVARVKAILDEHLAHLRSVATVESLLSGWLDSVSES